MKADELAVVVAILDSYNRGNALNLCALSALLASPAAASDAAPAAAAVRRVAGKFVPRAIVRMVPAVHMLRRAMPVE